ncbi:hypothetical protein VDG1235_2996 [Verrucomicrobiia bacterium DG1235]|nr:hypothetical protein VDG1235_2996 [Verrucomicrobiae bacterium DG1235]
MEQGQAAVVFFLQNKKRVVLGKIAGEGNWGLMRVRGLT